MTRFNIFLVAALAGCALSLVTSQHEARRTHIALERAQGEARRLDADWNHLRMQQMSLSAAALIDARARGQLGMDSPSPHRTLHAVRDPGTGEMKVGAVTQQTGSRSVQRGMATPSAAQPAGRAR